MWLSVAAHSQGFLHGVWCWTMCRTPETSAATGSVASQLITHLGAGVRNRHCYQGRLLSRSPIHYAVFFSGSFGDGIEMVQALDEAHAVDIVLAQHPALI